MILEMKDICKDYKMGLQTAHILKHVNLTVNEGDYLAVMGPSGSGKTTLMNLIGCLDVPTSGSYELLGKEITECTPKELAVIRNREIGFVFQNFNLLPALSALDNAALPLLYAGINKNERRERAFEALRRVGLEDRVDFKPNQLSGGQCQRVAIARAIVGEPSIILADEPTGALDSQNGIQVMELFKDLHGRGAAIIMITHDRSIAKHAEIIKYIRDGILKDTDEPEDNDPGKEKAKSRITRISGKDISCEYKDNEE